MNAPPGAPKIIKVLWLTSSYPRNEDDSASIFLRHLAEALSNCQANTLILAPDHSEVDNFPQPSGLTVEHFRYFFPRKLQKLAYGSGILPNLRAAPGLLLQIPFFILAMFVAAVRILVKQRPDLIHAHWIFPQGTVAVLLGKVFRLPVIVTAHGGDAFALKGGLLGAVKRWTVRNCWAWTSNTQATASAVGLNLPSPHILPMGIDYARFAMENTENGSNQDHPGRINLLFVGRLVEKKGAADLLRAFATVPEELRTNWQCSIIGNGVELNRLWNLARELDIADKVVFHGKLSNSGLPDYYAAADIFVAPSIVDSSGDTEGQGVMLLEAMASGTAVISTQTGGIAEVIEDGYNGILVEPNRPDQLAGQIMKLARDAELRKKLGDNARQSAKLYDWRIIAGKFAKLYRLLIS